MERAVHKKNMGRENGFASRLLSVAFIIDEYPTSSTFIMNQIDGLYDSGIDVNIYPRFRNEKNPIKPMDKYKTRVFYPVLYLPQNPISFLKIFLRYFLKFFFLNPKQILNSLNPFIFGKNALKLVNFYQIMPFLGKKFNIIQVHFGTNGDMAILLKKVGFDFKLFTMFHGYDIRLGVEKGGIIYRDLFLYGDYFQSICSYNNKKLIEFGLDPKKLVYHPVGIDVEKIEFIQRKPLSDHGVVEILSIGRLVWEKGYEHALLAIKDIADREYKFRYTIIGDGYLRDEIERLIDELDISTYVRLLGFRNHQQIVDSLRQYQIFLMSSVAEALPVVIMEAQASGMVVVATDVGSIKEEVCDGISGFIVPARDPQALSEKLRYLIDHSEIWETMGKKGSFFIRNKYDIASLNKKLVLNYFQSINGKDLT